MKVGHPSSECRMVLEELLAMSVLWQSTLRNIRRLTFNRNVVKLLDIVLEWQNPYSVTVHVVVPLHN